MKKVRDIQRILSGYMTKLSDKKTVVFNSYVSHNRKDVTHFLYKYN